MKKILFLTVGRRVELVQAFRSAALSLGMEVALYGEDASDTAPALAFCDRRLRLCRIQDAGYIGQLLEKAKGEHIDLVIPTIDTNLPLLAESRGRFEKDGIKVLVCTKEVVGMCRDKCQTARFFAGCGLKTPMPVEDWRAYRGGYPAFVKPRDGSSSIGAHKAVDEHELAFYAQKADGCIIQPLISGTEYTVDVFADFWGRPIYVTPRARRSVRAGEVLQTQICLDGRIVQACTRIAERIRPCGPITIQLIRDEKGDDYYIEINPRFGGGSPLSMKAGAGSAQALLRLLEEGGAYEKKKHCRQGDVPDVQQLALEAAFEKPAVTPGKQLLGAGCANKKAAHACQTGAPSIQPLPGAGGSLRLQMGVVEDGAIYSRFDQSVRTGGWGLAQAKGVVFDLDDTLYPEKEYVRGGCRAVAEYLGDVGLADGLWEDFAHGRPAIDGALRRLGREGEAAACVSAYRGHTPTLRLYDGAERLLKALRQRGIRVGVITDGRPEGQRAKIKALGLEGLADDIIITDELGGVQFRKPCDIAFRIMVRRWGLEYGQAVYVGDNAGKDFQAPLQLGMQAVWFKNAGGLYSAGSAGCSLVTVEGMEELGEMLLKNVAGCADE